MIAKLAQIPKITSSQNVFVVILLSTVQIGQKATLALNSWTLLRAAQFIQCKETVENTIKNTAARIKTRMVKEREKERIE